MNSLMNGFWLVNIIFIIESTFSSSGNLHLLKYVLLGYGQSLSLSRKKTKREDKTATSHAAIFFLFSLDEVRD